MMNIPKEPKKKRKNSKTVHKPKNTITKKITSNIKRSINVKIQSPTKKPSSKKTKIPENELTFLRTKKKKISGKWRMIHYFKDSKGETHQKVASDLRKEQVIDQPRSILKQGNKAMTKKLPPNIMMGLKAIAKDENEHSMALDFERYNTQPQRIAIIKGGKAETVKIDDFEFFGHTHPQRNLASPSYTDLKTMKTLEPEFIIAGKTGKTNIFNVEKPEKLEKHILHRKDSTTSTAVEQKDIRKQLKKKKYRDDPSLKNIDPYNITETKKGREMFFDITGIKVYPYKKQTFIEMKDDPRLEKRMPSLSQHYLEKYHRERFVP